MIEKVVNSQTMLNLFVSIVILLIALIIWYICKKACKRYLSGLDADKHTVIRILMDIARYIVIIGVVLLILQINGVNVSSAVAGLGIASAIVGLALQDILKDVIMGLNMITENFFSVGDVVEYKEMEGVVIKLSLRTTKLQSIMDNSVMTICNRNISEIRKCSSMVDIDIPLSYEEDVRKVHTVMGQISEKISALDGIERSEYKGTEKFDEFAIIYKMRFFCPPDKKPNIRRSAMKVIQEELNEAGIRIPYRKMDILVTENSKGRLSK